MSYIGTTKIGKMFLGNTEIAKAYLGTDLVFQSGPQPVLPYDSKVDYIQFNQSALNTGIVVSDTGYKVEIQCQVIDNYDSTQIIAGIGENRGQYFANLFINNTARYGLGSGSSQYISGYTSSEKKTFTLSFASQTQLTDGVTTIKNSRTTTPSNPIFIGRSGVNNYWAYIKVWYIKIYNGNTLVRDFIPVRKDGIGYFYDRVTKTLFGNTGTNDFIIGE